MHRNDRFTQHVYMKNFRLYLAIALVPFFVVIVVNELTKPEIPFLVRNKSGMEKFHAYNSEEKFINKCSWDCNAECMHKCKNRINVGAIQYTYEEIIKFNGSTDQLNYKAMSILFLVVLWPIFMYVLIVQNIRLYLKSKASSHDR